MSGVVIPVTAAPTTMSSREIAELVESRHTDVCRTIDRLIASKVIKGYAPTAYTHHQNGQMYTEYHVGKRDSYVIVAQLSPEFTARLVDRWQELEQALANHALTLPNFADPVAAARAWADEAEAKRNAERALEQAKPAIEFVEKYVEAATGDKTFRQVCKLLGANEKRFKEFLLDREIVYYLNGEMTPRSNHLDAERFSVKAGVSNHSDHAYNSMRFTPKGVTWIAGEWGKHIAALNLRASQSRSAPMSSHAHL